MHAGGSWIHPVTRWALYELARYLCAYCGDLVNPGEKCVRERGSLVACDDAASIDHLFTGSCRPRHAYTVVACWRCNREAGHPCRCPTSSCSCGALARRTAMARQRFGAGDVARHLRSQIITPDVCRHVSHSPALRDNAAIARYLHSRRAMAFALDSCPAITGLTDRQTCINCGPEYLRAYSITSRQCQVCLDCSEIPF